MNLGLHWRSRVVGGNDAERALLEEMQSMHGIISTWSNREHNDEGQHIDVTAKSVASPADRGPALSVLNGLFNAGDSVAFSGTLTTNLITIDQVAFSPIGIDRAFFVRFSTNALRTIGGLKDGPRDVPITGRIMLFFNAGSNGAELLHENVPTPAYFRFRLPGAVNVTIPPGGAALLYYDGVARRWEMIGASGGTAASNFEYNDGDSGPAVTVDWANGNQHIINLTDNAAITFSHPTFGQEYRILMTEGGAGNFIPTWPGNVIFENDDLTAAAIAAGETLIVHLIYTALGGGTYLATYTPYEVPPDSTTANSHTRVYEFVLGDGVSLIPSGINRTFHLAASGLITKAVLLSTDAVPTPCDLVLDIWKDTYANYPPDVTDTITASAKPTLASGIKYQDSTLTGWNKSYAPGDIWVVNVDSNIAATRASLFLETEEA